MLRKKLDTKILMIFCCVTIFILVPLGQIKFLTERTFASQINKKNNPLYIPLINDPSNETDPPIIVFIKPDINNTVITTRSYDIIVNITDENPPLPGNVSIEVLNGSVSLFNASMSIYDGDQWFFNWVNTSLYVNGETYTIRIRAKDSSLNENTTLSNELYIILKVYTTRSPSLLNGILYIIAVCVIIALIMVYIRRRALISSPMSKKLR